MGTPITFGPNNDQNIIVQAAYDKGGRLLSQRDPRGSLTTYAHDRLGRRTRTTDPLGHTWQASYTNSNGVLQTLLTDPPGNITLQSADGLGRLAALRYLNEDPKHTPDATFRYDKGGSRTFTAESNGPTTVRSASYRYDKARRLTQVSFDVNGDGSNVQTLLYTYDAAGNRASLALPGLSQPIAYTYDARSQLAGLADWAGQQSRFTYDRAGRLTGVSRNNGLRSQLAFDAAGHLLLERHTAAGRTLGHFAYTVDARGNRTQVNEALELPSSGSVTYLHDDLNVSYRGAWTAQNPYQVTTSFSAAVQLPWFLPQATLTMGQGPDHSLFDVYVDGDLWSSIDGYAAVSGDLVLTIAMTNEGPHTIDIRNRPDRNPRSTGYTLRFKSLTGPGQNYAMRVISYSYDNLSRLLSASYVPDLNLAGSTRVYEYTYDVAGNRTQQKVITGGTVTTNYRYNAANQVINDGYAYDAAGRLTSDGVNTYTWDSANRLLSINTTAYQYAYDGDGRRVQQTVSGTVTQYLNDVQQGLWQNVMATQGASVTTYVHGPLGLHEQLNADGSWRYPISDAQNTVRAVLDGSLTTREGRLMSPFGEVYGQTLASGETPSVFGFTGEPTDDNGLVQLRTRYYNPTLGQFFSLDPVEGNMQQPLSLNRYTYAGNNSVNFTDPNGTFRFGAPNPQLHYSVGTTEIGDTVYCIGRQGGLLDQDLAFFAKLVEDLNGASHPAFYWDNSQPNDRKHCKVRGVDAPCLYPDFTLKIPYDSVNTTGRMNNARGWQCGQPPECKQEPGKSGECCRNGNSVSFQSPIPLIGGYIEGVDIVPLHTVVFGTIGREVVFNFKTFQRAVFAYVGAAFTFAPGVSLTGGPYIGHVEGFTEDPKGPSSYERFRQQYGGPFLFHSLGIGIKTPFDIVAASAGVIHFFTPPFLKSQYPVYGNHLYLSAGVGFEIDPSFGKVDVGIIGSTYSFPQGWEKSYIQNCKVNIEELEKDIKEGSASPLLQGPYTKYVFPLGTFLDGIRQIVAAEARVLGTIYNIEHDTCKSVNSGGNTAK